MMTFVAVTRAFFDKDIRDDILGLAKHSAPIFREQDGLVSFRAYLSHDGSHVMSCIEWESQDHHQACMASEDWKDIRPQWAKLFQSGKARFELQTYSTIET